MLRTATVVVTLLALLAINATAASTAWAKSLVLSVGGTVLVPTDSFESFGEHSLAVTTSSGSVNCENYFSRTGLEVGLLANSRASDELQIARIIGGNQEPCRSFTGNAQIDLQSLAGPLKLRANGKASAGAIALLIAFEHIEFHGNHYESVDCMFAHKSVSGSNSATTVPQALEVALEATLALDVSRSSLHAKKLCPKKAEVSFTLPLTENEVGEEVEEHVNT